MDFHVFENSDPSKEIYMDFSLVTTVNEGSTLILCFTVGCQDKEAMAELEAFKAQAEVEEQNKEIVKRYFELMTDRNPAYLELLLYKTRHIKIPNIDSIYF